MSDFSKIQSISNVAKFSSTYVSDPNETLEHVSDLENFARFLEKKFGFGIFVKIYIYPEIFIEIGTFFDFHP